MSNLKIKERLEKRIPWGTSTCAKKATLTPEEPAVLEWGRGCRVWDADGREFIDFKCALGPVTLGYQFPEVDAAIRRQLDNGIVFSYPHRLEAEVAEKIAELVPWAEKARFLKTGGEAVAACFKIARAATGRKHIIQIGYNGWLNSVAAGAVVLPNHPAAAVPDGVPEELARLHHPAAWNRPDEVREICRRLDGQVAAIAVSMHYPEAEAGKTFYPELRRIADAAGALLIFDEIVTGFRLAHGGVGEHFGTPPDLAVFAKGLANGMPLSVYCGRARYMDCLDRAIVSSTHGGETLSLAAGLAVLNFYQTHDVIGHLWRTGALMWDGLGELFVKHGIPARLAGLAPARYFIWEPGQEALREKLMRKFFASGLIFYACGYVNWSHREADIAEALERAQKALNNL